MNASLHFQVRSIGGSHLPNRCSQHYHAADNVVTSGCSFISQQIRNKIFIMLAILSMCIKIEKLSVGKRSMYIHISGWHIIHLATLSSLIVTGWHRWRSRRRWHPFSCWMSALVRWRCMRSFATAVCQRILWCAIVGRKAAVHSIFKNHSQVSFYCSLHLSVPRKLNAELPVYLDFSARFLDQVMRFLQCGTWKPSYGHFGHIQGKVHVALF